MSKERVIAITVLLAITTLILIWFSSSFYESPLMVSILIISCAFNFGLELAYQRRIEDHAVRDTPMGRLVRFSGILLYVFITTILILLGVHNIIYAVGLLVLIFALPALGLLGRLLSIIPEPAESG